MSKIIGSIMLAAVLTISGLAGIAAASAAPFRQVQHHPWTTIHIPNTEPIGI